MISRGTKQACSMRARKVPTRPRDQRARLRLTDRPGDDRDEMSELNRLRCALRAINIEYSAIVRGKRGEAADARMAELGAERHALMGLIALERRTTAMTRALERYVQAPPRKPSDE